MNALQNINLLVVGITVSATAILGLIIFLQNKRSVTNVTFLAFALVTIFWGVLNYLSLTIDTPSIALWLARLVMFLAVWQAFIIFQLFHVFPEKKVKFSRFYRWGILPVVIFVAGLTLTPLVIADVAELTSTGQLIQIATGPAIPIFGLLSIGLVVTAIIKFFIKTLKRVGTVKKQMIFILLGVFITFSLVIIFNFIFPTLLNDPRFVPLGAVFFFPFILFTFYALLKHHLFDVKIIATEILTFTIIVLSLFELIFSVTVTEIIIRLSVFVALLIFGTYLIRSVLQEVERREEIARLASQLKKANTRLKQLDKTKSEFLSIASHQLRTPASGIKGYLSMLLEGDFGKVTKRQNVVVKNLLANIERLIGVINTFLNVSRIEQGRFEIIKDDTDMTKMIKSVMMDLQTRADQKNLDLKFTPPKSFPQIPLDEEKLRHVVINFIDNAIKYTPEGEIEIFLTDEGEEIKVCVKDTGIGLSTEDAAKLFEKFSRAQGVEQVHTEGSGLGLFVAKKVVEGHGGKIWAESEGRGKGSSFCFTLPKDKNIGGGNLIDNVE